MASVKPHLQRLLCAAEDENLKLRRRLFQLEQIRSRQLSDYVFAHIAIAFDLDIEIVKKIFDAGRGAFLRHKQKFCEVCPVLNFGERSYLGVVGGDPARYLQDRRRPGQRINRYAGTGGQFMGDFVGGRFYCLDTTPQPSGAVRNRREFLLKEKDETFHINGLTYKVHHDRHREWRLNQWKCAAEGHPGYSPEAQQNAREMLRAIALMERERDSDSEPHYVLKIVNEKKRDMVKHPIFQALGKGTIKQLQVKSYLLKDDEFQ